MADGWLPQFPPGDDLAAAIERLHGYARDAGRDPAAIGIECTISVRRDDGPQRWRDLATRYADLGATHLRVVTAGGGFTTPQEHLDAARRWIDALDRLRT
jgi:alkanesulfonate monooxygenase SsuD/methylene tetrahydromethanopterin reductase-like flavin-dependent oxidoreductase (luciferase family)